jgi:site-specific DNA recombinase
MTQPFSSHLALNPRAAIYARYSSDNQSDASIDDQVRVCRARAEREGWLVCAVYADYAISGASAQRPQFQSLLAEIRAGKIDIVLAEALDRLSRDQEHIAGFYKQASFAGARIVTLADGEINELHVGLKGTMSALFLKDLAQKTHRGLEGRVRAGHSGGGISFGYRTVRSFKSDGTPLTGEFEIAEAEAEIIRRIFQAYVDGQSPRSIAKQLNAESVPGPRGGRWTASLLLGNVTRENGMLRNRLYVGERVWNRQRFIKDPSTGKRVSRPNPREAWIVSPAPKLRIVSPEIWQAAQAKLAAGSRLVGQSAGNSSAASQESGDNLGKRLSSARRPVWPLSGLVRCGVCQGPLTVVGANGRLGCGNHVERGTCDNPRTLLRDAITTRVLVGLKERLLAPELVEEFVRTYVEEINAANRQRGHRQAGLSQERGKLERQARNLLELIKDGHGSPSMVEELRSLEARKNAVEAEIAVAGAPEAIPVLHPNLPCRYRRKVEALETALTDPGTTTVAAEALRELVDAVLVYPGAKRGEVTMELRGDLAAFLHLDAPPDSPTRTAASVVRSGVCVEVMGSLVAGAGNHLYRTALQWTQYSKKRCDASGSAYINTGRRR